MEEKQNACFLDSQPTKPEDLETGNNCIGRDSLITPRSRATTINESFLASILESASQKQKWRNISPEHPLPITMEQFLSQLRVPTSKPYFVNALKLNKLLFIEGNEPPIIDLESHLMPEEADA